MTSRNAFNAFAIARGEGLHPRLRELFDRTAARPLSELAVRCDGMLQAGPDPASDAPAVPSSARKRGMFASGPSHHLAAPQNLVSKGA